MQSLLMQKSLRKPFFQLYGEIKGKFSFLLDGIVDIFRKFVKMSIMFLTRHMNAELTELVFILDRSGSMGGLESDTIGGFNGMIAKQKAQGKKVNVTTVLFDDEVDIIHDRFPVEIVEALTEKEYFVRGCTALLDAVGRAIEKMENVQKHLPEDQRAGKIIFVITTDGLENSSEHFTQEQIRRKIEAKKECG